MGVPVPVEENSTPPPFMVLGLPVQDNKPALPKQGNKKRSGKTKLDSSAKAKEKVNNKMDSKRLSELLRQEMLKLGMGNGLVALETGDNGRTLKHLLLEMYIKRLGLVQRAD